MIAGIINIGSFIFESIVMAGKIMGVKIGNFFIDAINKIKGLYNSMAEFIGLTPLDITPRISEEGLEMTNTRMGEFMEEMGNNNIETTSDLTARLGEIWDEYGNKVIAKEEEIEKKKKVTNKKIVKSGKETTENLGLFSKKLTDTELANYAKSTGSAEDAMKSVVRAETMEGVAGMIASILKSMPFPLNAILAAGAGAAVGGLIDKGLASFAQGGEFITSGPQAIMVGDNPGGRELVQISPLSSPAGADAPVGGGITVNVSGNILENDWIETELSEKISEAVRRGVDFGIS